jgi:hypothetical protein
MYADAIPNQPIPSSASTRRTLGEGRLQIVRVPIDSLTPDPANPRVHGVRNLEAIKNSLRRFGQVEPLVVQAGSRRLVAGHGRLEALRALGQTEVDIVEIPLDNVSAAALNISLNQTALLAEWNGRGYFSTTLHDPAGCSLACSFSM